MPNTKDSRLIEILHNEWCIANGYPVRKRTSFKPGRPQVHKLNEEAKAIKKYIKQNGAI